MEEKVEASGLDYLESPVSDGTIEENFEEELVNAPVIATGEDSLSYPFVDDETEQDFSEVAKYGIVEVAGDDTYGRKVIVVSACKLPGNKELDHSQLLRHVLFIWVIENMLLKVIRICAVFLSNDHTYPYSDISFSVVCVCMCVCARVCSFCQSVVKTLST
jgi:hypothetical protein